MLVLVDGHNLIANMDTIQLDDEDDEDQLILYLRRYQARTSREVMVFFDAGSSFGLAQTKRSGGLTVRFAPSGTPADDLIINHLYSAKHPQQILVVTSDRAIQRVARSVKAKVMSAARFVSELTPPVGIQAQDTTEVELSEEEVEAWLKIFQQERRYH